MHRSFYSVFFFLIAIISLNCCTTESSQESSAYSDSLYVLKSAFNIKYVNLNGTQQVIYSVIEKYPASNVISEINEKLKSMGWRPLEKDWLNPHTPTSYVRGWTDYIDKTKNNNKEVHSWYCNWTNSQDDILIYSLNYNGAIKSKSIMTDLRVVAIYVPGKLAKERRARARSNP